MSEKVFQLGRVIVDSLKPKEDSGEVIEVSVPATAAASIYEKVRVAVDYQEEHLLRRNAILRILKRYLGSDVPIEKIVENLLKELIWARYLPNKEVPVQMIKNLVPIFHKYEPLLRAVDGLSENKDKAFEWVLEVMSTEVEYALTPPLAAEALVSYMYDELRERIYWDPRIELSDEAKDLHLYIAIHKALLRSNNATLRFRMFTLYYPDWPGASTEERIEEVSRNLDTIIETIDTKVTHKVTEKLRVLVRRKTGLFKVIGDVISENPDDYQKIFADPEILDREVVKALKRRTRDFRGRLRRTILRSVTFLFLTKMLLALLIELPYDLLIAKHHSFAPLLINIFFHPLVLAFIGITVTIPEKKNTINYVNVVRALMVGADHELLNIRVKKETFGAWSKVFSIVYSFILLAVYAFIGIFLLTAGFEWLSAALFLFFLSLVTFFGIRVRSSVKDLIISPEGQGIFGSIFDALMLPIVRVGMWLSFNVSKINVFIYFFDFIIESPYKVAVRFLEGWVGFIKEKKEEI